LLNISQKADCTGRTAKMTLIICAYFVLMCLFHANYIIIVEAVTQCTVLICDNVLIEYILEIIILALS